MKNWGLFLGGLATGVVLTFLFLFIYAKSSDNSTPDGVTNFEQVGEVINEKSVEVMQVIAENAALVHGEGDHKYSGEPYYDGPIYLIRNYDGTYYYDDQIIKRPQGKQFRQTGIYQYNTKVGYKTVPIIELK